MNVKQTCTRRFPFNMPWHFCSGGLLQTLGLREERWHNQSLAVDDGFNLSFEVTNSSFLSQISRSNCEATHKRFYLYWTIKLIDFFTVLHGIHMQGKGVSKCQSLENKRKWNWVDSRYAWKKFAKIEISLTPNSFTGN